MRLPVVGDRFYRVRDSLRHGFPPTCDWVVVEKVGRTWATAHDERHPDYKHLKCRFDIQTGRLHHDGFSSAGRVYDSEEAYLTAVRCKDLWSELQQALRNQWAVPDGVTEIDILKAADALKIKLKGE